MPGAVYAAPTLAPQTRWSRVAAAPLTLYIPQRSCWNAAGVKYLGEPRSGSAGALTWSRNRYGPYTRARAGTTTPRTTAMAAANLAWEALTDSQRLAWGDLARLETGLRRSLSIGRDHPLDGHARYVSAYLVYALFAALSSGGAPATPDLGDLSIATCRIDSWALTVLPPSVVTVTVDQPCWVVLEVNNVSSAGTMSPPGRRNYWFVPSVSASIVDATGGGTVMSSLPVGTGIAGRTRFVRAHCVTSRDLNYRQGPRVWARGVT